MCMCVYVRVCMYVSVCIYLRECSVYVDCNGVSIMPMFSISEPLSLTLPSQCISRSIQCYEFKSVNS